MNDPRPTMISARPPESRSTVENSWNTRIGSSELSTVTALVSRIRFVRAAAAASTTAGVETAKSGRWCSPTPNTSSPTSSASSISSMRSRRRCSAPISPCARVREREDADLHVDVLPVAAVAQARVGAAPAVIASAAPAAKRPPATSSPMPDPEHASRARRRCSCRTTTPRDGVRVHDDHPPVAVLGLPVERLLAGSGRRRRPRTSPARSRRRVRRPGAARTRVAARVEIVDDVVLDACQVAVDVRGGPMPTNTGAIALAADADGAEERVERPLGAVRCRGPRSPRRSRTSGSRSPGSAT